MPFRAKRAETSPRARKRAITRDPLQKLPGSLSPVDKPSSLVWTRENKDASLTLRPRRESFRDERHDQQAGKIGSFIVISQEREKGESRVSFARQRTRRVKRETKKTYCDERELRKADLCDRFKLKHERRV